MKKDFSEFGLDPKILLGCEFHDNISVVFVRTTEDKLRNILRDFKEAYSTKYSWTTPLGLALSFVATLVTTTFTDKYGCTKAFWEALFTLMCIACTVWLVIAGCKAIAERKQTKVQYIIDRIKDSVRQDA